MSNKISKNISKLVIDLESKIRSKSFYQDTLPLEFNENDDTIDTPKIDSELNTEKKLSKSVIELKKYLLPWQILEHPFLTQQEIYDHINSSSGSKSAKMKKKLISNGYIIEHKLQVGKTYNSIWEPTEKAYNLIGIPKPVFKSKGGYLHQYCAYHLQHIALEQKYHVDIEFFLENGKAVDLLVKNDIQTLFIEIVTSYPLEKEISNIIKDFSADIRPSSLLIVVQNGKMKKRLEKLVASDKRIEEFISKLQIVLAGNIIKERKIIV